MHTLRQIALWTGADADPVLLPEIAIAELCIDSRSVGRPEAALFIALPTAQRDGHRFIADAYAKGVRAFLVSDVVNIQAFPNAFFLTVPDTLVALQTIAAAVRAGYTGPVVGITGSNGKTIVKEWLQIG